MIEYIVCGGLIVWIIYEKVKNTSELVNDDLVVNFRYLNENQKLRIQGVKIPSFYKIDIENYPTLKTKINNSTLLYGLPTNLKSETEIVVTKNPMSKTSVLLSGNINWDEQLEKIKNEKSHLMKSLIEIDTQEKHIDIACVTDIQATKKSRSKRRVKKIE